MCVCVCVHEMSIWINKIHMGFFVRASCFIYFFFFALLNIFFSFHFCMPCTIRSRLESAGAYSIFIYIFHVAINIYMIYIQIYGQIFVQTCVLYMCMCATISGYMIPKLGHIRNDVNGVCYFICSETRNHHYYCYSCYYHYNEINYMNVHRTNEGCLCSRPIANHPAHIFRGYLEATACEQKTGPRGIKRNLQKCTHLINLFFLAVPNKH